MKSNNYLFALKEHLFHFVC